MPFTARSCETIGYNLLRITKSITPEYSLNVCWTTEKLARFYSPRLKLSTPSLEKISCVYEFKCPGCDSYYLGETKRRLTARTEEHHKESHEVQLVSTYQEILIVQKSVKCMVQIPQKMKN